MIPEYSLLLKLPDSNPPFIGITYDENYSAFIERPEAFLKAASVTFQLYLFTCRHQALLYLCSHVSGLYVNYTRATYNEIELMQWATGAMNAGVVNFGLVVKNKDGSVAMAKTKSGLPFCLPVHKVFIMPANSAKAVHVLSSWHR